MTNTQHWHGRGDDAVSVPGPVGDCCEAGRLTDEDHSNLSALFETNHFTGLVGYVESVLAAREAAAEQRGRDAVLADVAALAGVFATRKGMASSNMRDLEMSADYAYYEGMADALVVAGRDVNDLIAKHRKADHHETREEVGTGAGEVAPRQDTGSAWVTRSADCPEAPAQAHPLATDHHDDGSERASFTAPATRVHNHPPYRPVCPERFADGHARGACLNDDGSDR